VLAYVFQLRKAADMGVDMPHVPGDIPVPEDYQYPPAG